MQVTSKGLEPERTFTFKFKFKVARCKGFFENERFLRCLHAEPLHSCFVERVGEKGPFYLNCHKGFQRQ